MAGALWPWPPREAWHVKVLFVASGQVGHIDFGGGGFVHLDKAFRDQGHETSWFSFGDQVTRLRELGCSAADLPDIARINLLPITRPEEVAVFSTLHERRITALRRFLTQVKAHRPDLMVIDRLLVGAGLAADQLEIPYVAVGTPGGHWRFDVDKDLGHVNVHPAPGPVESYQAYGEVLKRDVSWSQGELDSGWLRSPYCNLHFMGASFYGHIDDSGSANIFNHKERAAPGTRIGFSFGNQGNTGRLKQLAEHVITETSAGAGISIFAGANEELRAHFAQLSHTRDVRVYPWIDFATVIPELACLAFLGGVGSIWHCIERGIPMVAAPGHIGDQLENARRISATGIGLHLAETSPAAALPAMLQQIIIERPYDRGLAEFRAQENYSDTMESFAERAARLAF